MKRTEELTAELKARNAGLHYLKQTDRTDCVEKLCGEIDDLRSSLTAATQELEGLRADRERLDWLEKQANPAMPMWTLECDASRRYWQLGNADEGESVSIRTAIDSAMLAARTKETPRHD